MHKSSDVNSQLFYILSLSLRMLRETNASLPMANAATAGGFSRIHVGWVNVMGCALLRVMIQHAQVCRQKITRVKFLS